jgi:hypothetical protein
MATKSPNALTLADWAKTRDPDGTTAEIVKLLAQTNEMLDEMVWVEGNLPTGHRTTVTTSLPTPSWRLINQGTAPSKGTKRQFDEGVGMLEDWSEVDVELARLNGDLAAFRMEEAEDHLEAMNQEMQQTILYGNVGTAPEEFTGLAPRYNDTTADNGQNVVLGGGAGADNTSIWLIGWGKRKVHGIFPKGSKAGIEHEDLSKVTVETSAGVAGNRMRAYQDHWIWRSGLVVRDWRYVVRIPNLDVSDMQAGNVDIIRYMIMALHRLPELRSVRPSFYCNRTVRQYLDIQAMSKGNVMLTVGEEEGRLKTALRGVPIRTVDQILNNESLVS